MDEQTKHPVPGENNSPDDLTLDKLMEKNNLHQRLVATARNLKKQKRKLKTAEDALRIRWGKVLNTAHKYGDSHHTKSYPKRKLLPEFDEEALEPPQSKNKEATRSDRRTHDLHRAAKGAALNPARDPHKDSHQKDGPTRSIYGPRKQALVSNATQQISEHRGTPKYRGAAHPLCFTNEVLDHEFPAGFKPVNIEAYDGTTDPGEIISSTYTWPEEMTSTP